MTATGTSMTTTTRAARESHSDQLATAVTERRAQLSLSMAAAEAAGGPSQPTLVRVESGQSSPLRPITLAKLDRALQWKRGTAARVYAGGDAAALDNADCVDASALTIGVSIDETARLLHAAADVAAAPDFPPELVQGFRHAAADLVGDVLPRLAACDNAGRRLRARPGDPAPHRPIPIPRTPQRGFGRPGDITRRIADQRSLLRLIGGWAGWMACRRGRHRVILCGRAICTGREVRCGPDLLDHTAPPRPGAGASGMRSPRTRRYLLRRPEFD